MSIKMTLNRIAGKTTPINIAPNVPPIKPTIYKASTKKTLPLTAVPTITNNGRTTLFFKYFDVKSSKPKKTNAVIGFSIIFDIRSEEHTSELQSRGHLVFR